MQIPQTSQAAQVTVTETASRTLPLSPGQVAQAVVVSAGKAGENVDIQLAGKIVTIQAGVDLQRGQTIELQRSDSVDKAAFKLLSVAAVPTDLRPGQTLLAEVIKLLPQQSILLALQQTGKLSVPLELDISRLSSSFKPGQQLLVQILSNSPLSVALQTPNQPSPETMVSQQRRLMPMVLAQPPQLQNVINALPELKNIVPVQNAVSQLWQNIRELQTVQQPANLQQAIQQSGVFLERQLLQPNPSLTGDFKANLLKLAAALEGQIRQTANGQINAQNLPPEIRTALINLLNQPAALQQLPSHITSALLAGGQTPAQLLTTLLAGQGSVGGTVTSNQPTSSQNAPVQQIAQNAQFQAGVTELARLQVLLREVETALARVQMNQLNMVREADSPTQQQVWLMDVPLRDKQQLQWMQLQFQQGTKQSQQDEEQWQVTLNLETQNLGKLRASIGLQSSLVSVALTAEDPIAVALLEENIDLLREKLAALDLQVQQLSCHCAPVEWLTPVTQTATSDALLDISV